jgi:two-component system, NtrC family, response regulator HydG
MRILVVDDEIQIGVLIKRVIETMRPEDEIEVVQDGQAALASLEQHLFDLVIVDYQMPGLTGLDVAAYVQRMWPRTPVILISGYLPPVEVKYSVKSLQLAGYLKKPFTPEELMQVVEQAFQV